MIYLPKYILANIKRHSLSESPKESCGFVLKKNDKLICFECENMADDKFNNFLISPKEYIKACELGEISYIYHSHPSESHDYSFTSLDKINSVGHKTPMILYNVPNDKFSVFYENVLEIKYVGRFFEYNKNDCFSLVEEFYHNEFNIELIKKDRDYQTLKDNPNFIIDNISNYGFQEIDKKDKMKYGDVLITKGINGPSHLMIYINNNQVLHHPFNNYSTICQYSDYCKNNTIKVIRHKNLC